MTQEEKALINSKIVGVLDEIMHLKSECSPDSDEHKALIRIDGYLNAVAGEISDMPAT